MKTHYRRQQVDEVDVFYREAGPADGPVVLLLHGFPSSSHMFRDLIPELSRTYRVIAPDLPGFGLTTAPPRTEFHYTFDRLAQVLDGFVDALDLSRFALYVFDYGAPFGLRVAIARPERITALVSQNGTPMSSFRAQIETNLFGVVAMTRAVIPLMREQGRGHVIQFSSVGGRIGSVGRALYSAAKWGVEGFSEVLAKEVNPLGIRVTIIEPGGFRTDFAGASTVLSPGQSAYDGTVGQAARFQDEYDGRQPGDPAKAAQLVLRVAALDEPPLRLLLGSDAVRIVAASDLARADADERWRHLSVSSDFEPVGH
jgi:NAD(P)-dependent dehydrogenase (short-subunit alcohol dehydrogenase family)